MCNCEAAASDKILAPRESCARSLSRRKREKERGGEKDHLVEEEEKVGSNYYYCANEDKWCYFCATCVYQRENEREY